MATELVQARIDSDLKESVSRILDENGLDIPTAIRMYFAKIEHTGGIPFDVRVELAHDFPRTIALESDDFDAFQRALESPMPKATRDLLARNFDDET